MNNIDKIAWIHLSEGRLLAARSHGKEHYYIPGGKRETGENDHEALIREVKEELSVQIQQETIQSCGTFEAQADGKAEGIKVVMACYLAKYEGTLHAAAEIAEIAWLSYKDRERVSSVSQLVMEQLHEQGLLL
ncbi:NUDIX hydrolase [Paenibacillus lacisoli]